MNIQMTDLNTTQYQQEYSDAAEASSHYCCPERDGDVHLQGAPVWTGPHPQPSLPGIAPHPQQHIVLTDMLNPLSYRFHCPCQSAQCQVTYPDYLLEPQPSQYQLLTGPAPGPADNSHPSSVCASWFADDPILCSMMPGDSHTCVTVDHQQLQEGPTGVTSHITQPVVCSVGGGGAVVLVNHCEAGPSFVPVETAHREDGVTPDVSVSGTPSQFTQYHETACPLYESRGQNLQPQAPPTRTAGSLCESKSRKPCHCTRSQCLKLYCECFANGSMCSNCDCLNCNNNAEHEVNRHKAIKSCLRRNPDAFRPKIGGGKSGKVKGWHNKGCNCKRSGCLKNYCECYEANIMCTSSCKCVGCRNYDDGSQTGLRQKSEDVKDGRPVSVITPAVVEAVCGCLLSQAEEAELEAQSPAQAESKVLEEFGHCLSQIIKAMSKSSTH